MSPHFACRRAFVTPLLGLAIALALAAAPQAVARAAEPAPDVRPSGEAATPTTSAPADLAPASPPSSRFT